MKSIRCYLSLLIASCIFNLILGHTCSASPEALATALAATANVKNGICLLPVAADGSLAAAFARNGFVVAAFERDPVKLATLRSSLTDSGLLGRSLYLGTIQPGHVAMADRSVDLAIINVSAVADLQAFSGVELLRLLSPYNGVALIGPLVPATEAAINDWAKGLPGAAAKEVAGSNWIMVRRGPLEGGSPWSHWFGGPDNNPVNEDSAFDNPSDVAWLGKPYNYPRHVGCRVAANGRVFVAIGAADYEGSQEAEITRQIVARSIFNGTVLWRRPLNENQRVLKSFMIAAGDTLWLADGPNILSLDAATGSEKSRVPVGKEGESCKWIAQADGILAVLVGPDDPKETGSFPDGSNMLKWKTERISGFGQRILAVDVKSGKILWTHEEPNAIAGRAIAAHNGQLFFFVPGQRLACIGLKTGKPVWENKDAAMLAGNEERVKDLGGVTVVSLEERPALLVTDNTVYLGQADAMNFYCFSAKDGAQLWTAKRHGGRAFNFLALKDQLFINGTEPSGILDGLTGKKAAQQVGFGGGCGVFTASTHSLQSQNGGATLSLPEMKKQPSTAIKTQCQLGTFVADGSLLAVPASCHCTVARGFLALTKASEKPVQTEALETFSPDLKNVIPLPVTAGDWPTHRANNQHTGSSPVDAPATIPKELWTWKNPVPLVPATDSKSTPIPESAEFKALPPVTGGGFVFVAAGDGSIRCLDSANGSLKWTAWTDGAIFATPSVADGRLFVGSADGRVYAFEAATGKLLWRSTLAPSTDKVMVYGHLQSRWPVNSGVLVQDGIVYAAAGMLLQTGLRVVALDAVTGAQKWQNTGGLWKEGMVWQMPAEISLTGYMTIFNGKLWVRSFQGSGGGAAFDLATGALQEKVPVGGLRGREIGVIKNKALVYGGLDLYSDRSERTMGRGGNFSILSFGSDAKPLVPDTSNFESSALTPAWNDAVFLTAGTKSPVNYGDINLECWDIDKMLTYVSEKAVAADFEKLPTWRKNQFPAARPAGDIENPTFRLWGPVKSIFAAVLIANKTAITVSTPSDKGKSVPGGTWKLSAQNLQDGHSLWELELPSQPARDGLCIDRNGHLIISFDDGSTCCYGL